ncbi:TolC family outer membrane protein [Ruixingdingia sedimenti]|uniref:TolC family outer membrane protein n=1 Tax=Ruixingdingia sedimenti TaxID=3073604 RepID=A0ABU1F3Y8_9RHOB|nr:TolC family outer membrane protein [Xinfangfangia sp. LG-4]MDR5651554.1 TolC family outer membrane protein [Xinfangfangia sp. LG-4]
MTKGFRSALLAAVFGAAATLAAPPAVHAETLTDALIAAYRSSNLLDQNRAVLRAADEDVAVAVSALRPVVAYSMGMTKSSAERLTTTILGPRVTTASSLEKQISLSAEITLFDFGARRLAIDAAKELVLATRQSLVGVEHQVLFGAVQAYTAVLLAEDTLALRQSNVRVIQQELNAAQDRFELGEVTRTDVAIAEARLAAARANLALADGDLRIARETYNLAVGNFPGRLRPPPRAPQTARTLEEAKAIAQRNHYAIKQLQHEVRASEINVLRVEASQMPNVTASARAGRATGGLDSASVGVQLSQPLYQGGRGSALFRQAIARRDATRAALHQTAASVEEAVGQAWARISVARAAISAGDQQIRAARAAYEGIREEATLGARTTLDVLNAEQELLDAQAARLSAVTTEYNATYGLLAAMGLLTVEHLGLGIPTYDATAYYNAVKDAPATSTRGKRLERVLKSIGAE